MYSSFSPDAVFRFQPKKSKDNFTKNKALDNDYMDRAPYNTVRDNTRG